ncbi:MULTISPECIES: DUF1338 domain-containing protein [Reichenbachiella]|uniref:DUF1338 domain-containing protein n=1 Tax=Reichenbachiella TaxID=156993 RepID=UPI000E6B9948|nr:MULTISPECIES: DUF1338 domain-containing protein [Reichenbachiella]MBU2915668.1 DUF1338 domain-containing protein [Reichenbachiella agariperforans]RJE72059.1 succinyldiaminopimelate aminotransferase [Reichenbachiella sp. MSK19-1]
MKSKSQNTYQEVIARCWSDYVSKTPSAEAIHDLLADRGEHIVNDHIAFRTFNHPKTGISVLEKPFLEAGYKARGTYHFEAKKLVAQHYEHPDADAPKIFISELLLEEFSPELNHVVSEIVEPLEEEEVVAFPSRPWQNVSFETYQSLLAESEYAAWMYVFGFCANHFTILVNELKGIKSLEEMDEFLKSQGFEFNISGGEIKGTPAELLEQSSILADKMEVDFVEGKREIPSCYYEFARRYADADGKLFQGFIAKSADKIFESTDVR